LLKSLITRLTPARQILLIIGLSMMFVFSISAGGNVQINNNHILGALILLFILLLELKDKLLAKSELSEGHAVQKALLPQDIPQIPGWDVWFYSRPANDVGGDLVDYLEISKERIAFILSDISGKGLGAALLMAKLQSIFRALAPDFDSPGEFISKINSVFFRDSLKKSFASLIYLEVEPNGDQVQLVNAGHLPPFYISNDAMKELSKGQRAIGLSEKVNFKKHSIALKKNDVLFIYSDGLTEAQNSAEEFFDKRLDELLPALTRLSAEASGKWIIDAVEKFIGSARVHDDLSLLILKRTS